jgi:hypothetical protein
MVNQIKTETLLSFLNKNRVQSVLQLTSSGSMVLNQDNQPYFISDTPSSINDVIPLPWVVAGGVGLTGSTNNIQIFSGSVGPVKIYNSATVAGTSDTALGVRVNGPLGQTMGTVGIALNANTVTANQGVATWNVNIANAPLTVSGSNSLQTISSSGFVSPPAYPNSTNIATGFQALTEVLNTQPVGSSFNPFTQDVASNNLIVGDQAVSGSYAPYVVLCGIKSGSNTPIALQVDSQGRLIVHSV